ncbi:uroporphyrinogen-III synthase [Marinobacter daepoensis]|uniref:Uroporphyrinogen-III synthase n=1 Tax=Marinobacter daepoensis TaxID=262077 RepID=A0ABS3B9S5_9GAMM|nr:uroporphyrinogen-III synthase [Marinobacter daepoensis]MBN7768563.1 uroporphyrinogen-III synthase [Marinobacter daepoensis]MBY6079300.1 uroporphyrinogen-III synthase [Marinobacter daepoensis]
MATPRADTLRQPELEGRRVLVCRPEPEGSRLAEAFRRAGAEVRLMPMMVREPLPETPEQRSVLQVLDNFSHVIAVSPYAARRLLDEIDHWWPQFPTGLQYYGVGAGTAAVFREHGLKPRMPAEGWTSEALLALPSLQNLSGEKVLLARGEHGRELIRQTLAQRGAQITTLALYRRSLPYYSPEQVQETFTDFHPEVVIALSGETLNNLVELGARHHLKLDPDLIVIPAQRVAEQALAMGFRKPFVPDSLSDDDLVTSVASCLSQEAGNNG